MHLLATTRSGLFCLGRPRPVVFGEGQEFLALACAPSQPGTCYAARAGGAVHRSADGGRSWAEVGEVPGFEELSSLAVDPRAPDRLLAGMEPAALFHSEDGGRTWEEDPAIRAMSRENGWSVPWSDAKGHVRTIAIDPNDPERNYLAIEVGGVVRTEDDGQHWSNVHGGVHDDVHAVAVDPKDGAVVYAATRHGFGRSEDYGRTWSSAGQFEGQGYSRPLAVDPQRPGRVFTAAATTGPQGFSRPVGSECGIFRSEDGGFSWIRLTHGIPGHFKPYVDTIALDPAEPDHVALADAEGHLYQSRDGGDSWRLTHSLPPVRRLAFAG
jgi:photosystem II stability/assembly factor-like uncharacterized protein